MNLGEGGLFLLRQWVRPGRHLWLGLDLLGSELVHEIPDPFQPEVTLDGALVLGVVAEPTLVHAGQCLFLPESLLWALIDPLQAGSKSDSEHEQRYDLETQLRQEQQRLRGRLAWWQEHGLAEGGHLRGLLGRFQPDLTVLLEVLDQASQTSGHVQKAPPIPPPSITKDAPSLPDLNPAGVKAWLNSPSGLGAIFGSGFSPRSEQADMGSWVTEALVHHHPLLVESGTGVGKTLAYLLPLLAAIHEEDARAVVATHTRALQVQILEQDLPRLKSLVGDMRCELLMGRRNYLCLRQRRAFLSRPCENLGDALGMASLRMWLRATRVGMREEIEGHPYLHQVLAQLFDTPEPCIPGACYEGTDCFVQTARRRGRGADLLIVNHSLLMHDLKAARTLLGEYDHLVIDEAHRLPQVALDTHGLACGRWRIEEIGELLGGWGTVPGVPVRNALLAARLEPLGPEATKAATAVGVFGRLAQECHPLFQKWWSQVGADLAPLMGQGSGQWRLRIRAKDETFRTCRATTLDLLEKLAETAVAGSRFTGLVSALDDLSPSLQDDLAQVVHACQLIGKLQEDIHFLILDPDDRWVTWVETTTRAQLRVLGATLVESGELLREYWLGNGLFPVLTSATLAVGEDFSHMLRELGLTRRRPVASTHTSPSPFDYHRQVLVLTPNHFLPPDAGGFGSQVGQVLATLNEEIGRKVMGLFTSYRQLSEAGEVLLAGGLFSPGSDHSPGSTLLLEQSPGSPAAPLMAAFRRAPRAVLLGTASFWEGVDFPGQDLEILVVAKLPFLVPSDPWVQARCDLIAAQGDNPFTDFMVRDAVLRLKQGFGRLIRRSSDRGVIIILDTRLHTKKYGATFLASMPVIPRCFGDQVELVERVREFFANDG